MGSTENGIECRNDNQQLLLSRLPENEGLGSRGLSDK